MPGVWSKCPKWGQKSLCLNISTGITVMSLYSADTNSFISMKMEPALSLWFGTADKTQSSWKIAKGSLEILKYTTYKLQITQMKQIISDVIERHKCPLIQMPACIASPSVPIGSLRPKNSQPQIRKNL